MVASPRERRAAVWPWLVMPLVVLAVFFALLRMHHRLGTTPAPAAAPAPTPAAETAPKP